VVTCLNFVAGVSSMDPRKKKMRHRSESKRRNHRTMIALKTEENHVGERNMCIMGTGRTALFVLLMFLGVSTHFQSYTIQNTKYTIQFFQDDACTINDSGATDVVLSDASMPFSSMELSSQCWSPFRCDNCYQANRTSHGVRDESTAEEACR
jgi:hypothetical protein